MGLEGRGLGVDGLEGVGQGREERQRAIGIVDEGVEVALRQRKLVFVQPVPLSACCFHHAVIHIHVVLLACLEQLGLIRVVAHQCVDRIFRSRRRSLAGQSQGFPRPVLSASFLRLARLSVLG